MNDGYLFCVTLGSGEIKFYEWTNNGNSNNPTCVYTLQAHSSPILSLDFDPRGRLFATGSTDAIIHIWDIQNLLCIKSLTTITSPIKSLSFSFDGELIAAGSEDNFIHVFRVDTGETVKKIPMSVPTLSVAWHPNRHILAYAGEEIGRNEGMIRVFGYSTTGTTTTTSSSSATAGVSSANTASSSSVPMGHVSSVSRGYASSSKPMLPHPPPPPQFFPQAVFAQQQWNPGYYQGQPPRSGYRY
jgi:WD40 repeat protein